MMKSFANETLDITYSNPTPYDFDYTIQTIEKMLQEYETDTGKIALLNYAIQAILMDVASSSYTAIFRDADVKDHNFRACINSENGVVKTIDLSNVIVWSTPWNKQRLSKAVFDIYQNGFKSELNRITGFYFKEINLLYIENGRHHTAAAAVSKKGSFSVLEVSMDDMISSSCSDGISLCYKIKENPLRIEDINDVRVSLILELYRKKRELEGYKTPQDIADATAKLEERKQNILLAEKLRIEREWTAKKEEQRKHDFKLIAITSAVNIFLLLSLTILSKFL